MIGSAKQWWRHYISSRPAGSHPLSWTQFTQVFLSKFFPHSERERKRAQFEGLQQNGMSVAEYEVKFHALARHASMILPTEAERVRRFVKGLINSDPSRSFSSWCFWCFIPESGRCC